MDPRLLLVVGALFTFVRSIKNENGYAKLIGFVSIIAVVMIVIPKQFVAEDGYYLLTLTLIGNIVYALAYSSFNSIKKIVIISSATLTALPIVFFLLQNPLFNYAALVCGFLQLVLFVILIVKLLADFKNEIGFLGIHTAFSLIHFMGGILIVFEL